MNDWLGSLADFASWTIFVLLLCLPLLGYWFLTLDIRSYLRALNRKMMVIYQGTRDVIPAWARRSNPLYFEALGLDDDCTEQDIKDAYRRLAEELHPDRGGDRARFLALKDHQRNALDHVRRSQPAPRT